MARRADNHVDTVASEFDTAFFAQAKAEGTSYTPASDAGIEDLLEGIIQTLESVKNDYVRGVPRNMIRLVLDPLTYGKARNYLDKRQRGHGRRRLRYLPRCKGIFFYQSSCDVRSDFRQQDEDHYGSRYRHDRRRYRTAGSYLSLQGA